MNDTNLEGGLLRALVPEGLLEPMDKTLKLIKELDSRISPADRQVLLPQLTTTMVHNKNLKTTVEFLTEFGKIMATIPDEHQSDFVSMSGKVFSHYTSIALAAGDVTDQLEVSTFSNYEDGDSDRGQGDNMPEDDIIMSEDDIMSDYMDSDSEGAAREWTVTEDSNVQDLDDSDLEWDARGYQADIGLKLRVDDTTHGGASRMENLRRAAFTRFKFDPQLITQGDEVLKLVPAELHLMLRFFFKEMVDPVCDRVHGVIWAHTLVDTAATIAHGRDKKTQMLEALKLGPGSNEITRIQYHIALVRLSKSWARIKLMVSTEPLTAKAEEFLSYAPPAEGVSNVDRAMAVVCNNFRIEKSAFQSYLNDATLVSSLVEVFGKGSIMFCGSVIFGHRSSPIPASASWFFFQVIKAADKDNVLQMIADKLKLSVVRYIWNDKSIPWAHNRENRLYCLDKMPLFPLLSALTETIKNY